MSEKFLTEINFSDHNNLTLLNKISGASDAWICPDNENNILAIFQDIRKASAFVQDYKILHADKAAYLLKELPVNNNDERNSRPLLIERGEIIKNWRVHGGVLACSAGALMSQCMAGGAELELNTGKIYTRVFFNQWLENSGYARSNLVWLPGQYVQRGFIIDVYDPAYALPLRLEFSDDELEQISAYKPDNQMTVRDTRALDKIILHDMNYYEPVFPVDVLPENTRVIFYEPAIIESKSEAFKWLWNEIHDGGLMSWTEIYNRLANFNHVNITADAKNNYSADFKITGVQSFKGDFNLVKEFFKKLDEKNYALKIFSRIHKFEDREIINAELSSGFIDDDKKIAFISDRELSGIIFNDAVYNRRAPTELREKLTPGQVVMHEDYGIGIFTGIEKVKIENSPIDVLAIEFAENQRLLIPVMQSYKLTPLASHADESTKLDKLSGKKWKAIKTKTQEQAAQEAKILMDILAKRELERREPISEIDEMYKNFVNAFQFEETADQLKAVDEIMSDLSSNYPMDRLLVGDVGFGKTEVALRAAFRFVLAGFQVCVLVPTTVLAQRHYVTFQSRLAGFPVKVGLLSRFVTEKNSRKILNDTEKGQIDILIGTHKLLSHEIKFRKLGFLIIDEEHRFGVMHKELLKKIYGHVDILSLSATPIPRTLAMSLQGLRSISILSTPPENRLPVATFAGAWNVSTIRRAITYELNRGGQVYFLSNKISRMDDYKNLLDAYFPDASIKIAHGQMNERELEKTMLEFYSGNIDILIATTIIESGLDVGRANTIIIDNASELGLAQMYQLRGRVGRRGENAFAYFFYPSDEKLNLDTQERLEAISTMTELGSGYDIARRDLDIRGSGELGGTHQHGNFKGGNIHLFYKMLENELAKLRGLENKLTDIKSDRANGYIPENYIPQDDIRVLMYRRFLRVRDLDELDNLLNEMADRFGQVPVETNFGGMFEIERLTIKKGLVTIKTDRPQIPLKLKKYINYLGREITYE